MQIVPEPCTYEKNLKLLLLKSEVSAGVLILLRQDARGVHRLYSLACGGARWRGCPPVN